MSVSVPEARMSKSMIFKWIIAIGLPAAILLIPANEVLTRDIKLFLAITLWAILCFAMELLDNTVPAILLPFLYCLLGLAPLELVLSPWTAEIPWMCLGHDKRMNSIIYQKRKITKKSYNKKGKKHKVIEHCIKGGEKHENNITQIRRTGRSKTTMESKT